MFTQEQIYILCIAFLIALLLFVAYKLYKFSVLILELEESIEDSLDILNYHYGKINEILDKPIFFDSVEIRQVVNDIRSCHSAVMAVANKLTFDAGIQSEFKEKNTEENTLP